MSFLSYLFVQVAFLCLLVQVHGYIPAHPSNVTLQPSQANPRLHLQWFSDGSDWEVVSPQLVGSNANNEPSQGILVHFTEDNASDETTNTPWIALISCDSNSTHPSHDTDIFSIAKGHGARSAILYSLSSETCVINLSYQHSPLNVFTTQSLNASRHIEYEFGQFGPSRETYYGYYNPTMLNDAAQAINNTITSSRPAAPGFLFATLPAYNTSSGGTPSSGLQADANDTSPATATNDTGPNETGVAMIILYAITGCVSALFCGVIVSGAIRAMRHPERYGPRRADPQLGGGQSRAGGLGRAILDTFPVVKFGSSGNATGFPPPKDVESAPAQTESSIAPPPPNSLQLTQLSNVTEHDGCPQEEAGATTAQEDSPISVGTDHVDSPSQTNTADQGASRVPASSHEIVPESIGRETCPICIVDFEEGDDLRVLPCEGKHRFHQSCVDPWLLELSGSCPICRQDFRALETIIAGGSPSGNRNRDSTTSMQQNRRFSRYLRFALGRQGRVSSGEHGSPPSPDL